MDRLERGGEEIPFRELLGQVRETDLSAFAHAEVPFEQLVEALDPQRSQARHPIFQVALAFQNMQLPTVEMPGLTITAADLPTGTAKFDLQVTVLPDGSIEIDYATDLFDRASVTAIGTRLSRILETVVADPGTVIGDIELLDADERVRALQVWPSGGADTAPETTIVELFRAVAAVHRDRIAVRYDTDALTYGELDEWSNKLAHLLVRRGVGPETLVAVALPRSLELVVAVLATLKAGGAYVPIDPAYPADRIAYVLADAAPGVVITWTARTFDVPAGVAALDLDALDVSDLPGTALDTVVAPAHLAYVIYTSGSTGRPKGVAIPHGNVAKLLANTQAQFKFGPEDVWTLFHSYAFDFSVWELWGALLYGGTLVVVDYYTARSPEQFVELVHREGVTVLNQTPSAFYQFAAADAALGKPLALRYIIFGGEALELRRLGDWYRRHDAAAPQLVNMYGITETTVHVTSRPLDAETAASASASLVGAPIPGLRGYVLDARLRPVPAGVAGEIYVAGPQLARGYRNQPGLTAVRFVANPFAADGSCLYRSGDVARWSAAGELDYVGRADAQVKVRGFRIELGEIEAAVLACADVAQVAVIVHADRIVAYVVPTTAAIDVHEVRDTVAATLPDYMVPAAFVVLDAIPLTVNGKLDRRALPAPTVETTVFRAPATAVEEIVAGVFAAVLGLDGSGAEAPRIGRDDDFFALGGNSLVAAQAAARIGAALECTVPVRALFEASTVTALASRVTATGGAARAPKLVARQRPERVPLSLAQQRMWFLNRFSAGAADNAAIAYNIPFALRLTGSLDLAALRAAVRDLCERHETLRTVYPDAGDGPVQVIVPAAQAVPGLEVEHIAAGRLRARLDEFATAGFDVTVDVPIRMALFATDTATHVLAVVVHHISADGYSQVAFVRDLATAYAARLAGRAPAWQPLAVQYADYALWQRDWLGDEHDETSVAARQIAFWRTALAGLPDQLELPQDRPRPPVQSYRGARVEFDLDARVHAGLVSIAREQHTTLFMVVHAVFAVLLARLSGTGDIAVGTPIAGRGAAELDGLVGMFVNTVVFRTQVQPAQPFTELLARVRESDLTALDNADIPFERLVEVLNPARSTARHPVFQVGLSFQNIAHTELALPGLAVAMHEVDTAVAQFDLQLVVVDRYGPDGRPGGLDCTFSYATDLFDAATVQSFADRLGRLFEAVIAAPTTAVGAIDLLDPVERATMVAKWNDTSRAVPAATLDTLFAAQVERTPDAVALQCDASTVTYRELDARANRLARYLIATGVGPESLVGLAIRRSVDLVVAMYAIVKAGGAYVPIDPEHPAERIAQILQTADPVCVLTTRTDTFGARTVAVDAVELSAYADTAVSDAERRAPLRGAHTAYVIFTSGSTGVPKGVSVPHAAVVNQMAWLQSEFPLAAADAVLLKTAATFDLSVWEFWSALTAGARLVVARPGGQSDPDYLLDVLHDAEITTLHAVPSMLTMLLAAAGARGLPGSLRRVLAIGEALPAATIRDFRAATSARLVNLYGPTEAAVSITACDVTDLAGHIVPIGAPEWNSRVYVLDARLNPVPVGVAGELYLAGAQLARGYHGRTGLTADRFVADPFGAIGERMYRTGDIVAWRSDGTLVYRERADFQVKVRGFRIELGDIEAVLAAQPGVATAIADVRNDRVVAYVVAAAGHPGLVENLKAAAVQALPSYMVPSAIVELAAVPLSVNGKINRALLPDPDVTTAEFRAPATELETCVADVFAQLLGASTVGRDDDFFALGGNSLSATQAAARLAAALGTQVPVALFFAAPVVADLAAHLATAARAERPALTARERDGDAPLSLAQQRMWVLNQMDRTAAAYNIPIALRLRGQLDTAALHAAIVDIMGRHEVLRTSYPDTPAGPVQRVHDRPTVDLAVRTVPRDEVPRQVAAAVGAGFDVAEQVPIRLQLLRVREHDEHVLVVVVHHIGADGFSVGPLTRDLLAAYAARTAGAAPDWRPLPVQYADYAVWQRELLGDPAAEASRARRQIDYWTKELAGSPEQLELPTDRPRPPRPSMRGATIDAVVPADVTARVAAIARERNASSFMVVHAAMAVLLSKLSGSNDIPIGTPVAGRGDAALDDLVGMFVNTVVLRTRIDPAMTFAELLDRVRTTDLAAFEHADVPFEHVVDALGRPRTSAHTPLFGVLLAFQNMAPAQFALPGLEVALIDDQFRQAKFDLQVTAAARDSELDMHFTYATELFDEATIRTFADRLRRVLDVVCADPQVRLRSIDVRTETERAAGARRRSAGAGRLPELVAAAAQCAPEAIALEHPGHVVRFGELAAKLAAVSAAMGAKLTADALVNVALAGLVPGLLPALGADGLAAALNSIRATATQILDHHGNRKER